LLNIILGDLRYPTWVAIVIVGALMKKQLATAHNPMATDLTSDISTRRLRSTDTATCVVRRSNNSFGDRCFAAVGPRLWNTLPIQLRHCDSLGQFKRSLKTYLFDDWDRGALWHLLGAPCINHLTYLLTYFRLKPLWMK